MATVQYWLRQVGYDRRWGVLKVFSRGPDSKPFRSLVLGDNNWDP